MPEPLPAVCGDAREFQQVIFNLVNNAVAAMQGHGGTLTISATTDDGWVHLSVADTGTGIPDAIKPRIFDPFFTTKKVGRGHRAGALAVLRDRVEVRRSDHVLERGGRGPAGRARDGHRVHGLDAGVRHPAPAGRSDGMTQRILALDDEIHMLRLLERIVTEKTPYEIVTSHNVLELPALLERARFDLIITDLKMPGMDGLDVLRFVKAQGRDEEVIIITAFGSLDTAVEALSHGVFDYITKPFKKEQIVVTVDRAMRWQRMKQEARARAPIFDLEPYAAALRAFEREYVRRLRERHGGNLAVMLERSGLPEDVLARVGREPDTDAT